MKLSFRVVCFLLILTFVVGCSPCLNQQHSDSDHIILESTTSSGVSIDVVIAVNALPEEYWNQDSWHWGAEFKKPKTTVSRLQVTFGGETIFVPFSAFSDLANTRDVSISISGEDFSLILKGGDAATAYTAEINFKDQSIQSRKVTHGEFKNVVWEETVYSFHKMN